MRPLTSLAERQRREFLRHNRNLTNRQLAMMLRESSREAAEMARRIGAMPGVGAQTRAAQLRLASQGAHSISSQLWTQAGQQIREGVFASVDMAINHVLDVDRLTGMPLSHIEGYAPALRANSGFTARALVNQQRYGFTLSERVWRNQALSAGRIQRTIQSGLVRNLSARELAREVQHLIRPDTPGGVSYAATRLARTEINNAYHWAHREQSANRPWVEAEQWTLSGSHPEPDICDELAEDDVDGLGAGLYRPRNLPDKPHPHCLCYTTSVVTPEDQFVDTLVTGGYDDWLEEHGYVRIAA